MSARGPRGAGLRVTGGEFRSRRLRSPQGGVRPTADRVRESLFARLGDLSGARVLDLYAGSGALGIEALSRGAEAVVFVERSKRSVAVLEQNLASLEIQTRCRVVCGDAVRTVRRLGAGRVAAERFHLVLLDPPYASDEAGRALAALVEVPILAPGATLVVERGRCHAVPAPQGLALLDERRYGDTWVMRYRASADEGGTGEA